MSANINSIMYYGEKPWHGIGTELNKPATAAEAISAAKLDWEVKAFPIFAGITDINADPNEKIEEFIPVKDARATIRMDTKDTLGVVGRLYTPIQNVEAFGFFDGVVGEGKAIYHVCGALGKGETIWILAKMPGEIRILKTDDIIEKYLLLTNNHDGLSTMKMFFTPIRVVCNNTLSAANTEIKKSGGDMVKIKHLPGLQEKVEAARVVLGLVDRTYTELQEAYNKLASYQVNDEWIDVYIKTLIPAKDEEDVNTRTLNIRDKIKSCFESESNTLPGIKGSAWAAYNSITEFQDHFSLISTRNAKDTTARLASNWLGRGADLKKRAFHVALDLIDESGAAKKMAEFAPVN